MRVDQWLAECDVRRGDLVSARRRLERLLAAGVPSRQMRAEVVLTLGYVAERQGLYGEAARWARESSVEARAIAYRRLEVLALLVLARTGEDHGVVLEPALEKARQDDDLEMQQELAHYLGVEAYKAGNPERGSALLSEAREASTRRLERLGEHRRGVLESVEFKSLEEDLVRYRSRR